MTICQHFIITCDVMFLFQHTISSCCFDTVAWRPWRQNASFLDCLFVPTKSAKRKSVKSFDNDWAAQLCRFAPSRFDKLSVMLCLHRFSEVVDIKPIFYCMTRSKNYNQLVINCWRYLALVRKVDSTLQHSRKGCAWHTTANKQRWILLRHYNCIGFLPDGITFDYSLQY